jgi:hypothetical protein
MYSGNNIQIMGKIFPNHRFIGFLGFHGLRYVAWGKAEKWRHFEWRPNFSLGWNGEIS